MEPALDSRNVWLEQERVRAEEQAKLEQARQVESLRREAAAEKRRRIRANVLAGAAMVGLFIAVWQFGESNRAKKQAEDNLQIAIKIAEFAFAQLRVSLEEQIKRQTIELENSRRKVEIFKKGDENELVAPELRRIDSLETLILVTQAQLDSLGKN